MKRFMIVLLVLISGIFGSDNFETLSTQLTFGSDNSEALVSPLEVALIRTNSVPASSPGNDIAIKMDENICDVCYFDLKKNEKKFYLTDRANTNDKKEHLKHANRICEACVKKWLLEPSSNGRCPLCRKPLTLTPYNPCTQCKIRCQRCKTFVYNCVLKILSLCIIVCLLLTPFANILIPGFLTTPHGFIIAIMYAVLHDIWPTTRTMSDYLMVQNYIYRNILPLIFNMVFVAQDATISTGKWGELFDGAGEGEEIQSHPDGPLIFTMIFLPALMGIWRCVNRVNLFDGRTIFSCITKLMQISNHVIPFLIQYDFFPILYFGSLLQKTQQTIWLIFWLNVVALIKFQDFNMSMPGLNEALGYAILTLICISYRYK